MCGLGTSESETECYHVMGYPTELGGVYCNIREVECQDCRLVQLTHRSKVVRQAERVMPLPSVIVHVHFIITSFCLIPRGKVIGN